MREREKDDGYVDAEHSIKHLGRQLIKIAFQFSKKFWNLFNATSKMVLCAFSHCVAALILLVVETKQLTSTQKALTVRVEDRTLLTFEDHRSVDRVPERQWPKRI